MAYPYGMGSLRTFPEVTQREGCLQACLGNGDQDHGITAATLLGLIEVLAKPQSQPLVLTGADTCFSIGYDPAELRRFDATAATAFAMLGHQAASALEHWPGVTIALIHGPCLGPGLELVLACDLIIATRTSVFGLPGLAFGLMPCMGGLRRLGARCGPGVTRDVFLAGKTYTGRQALRAGLIDRLVHPANPPERLAKRWGTWEPSAVNAIRSIRLGQQGPMAPTAEAELFAYGFATGECQRRLGLL